MSVPPIFSTKMAWGTFTDNAFNKHCRNRRVTSIAQVPLPRALYTKWINKLEDKNADLISQIEKCEGFFMGKSYAVQIAAHIAIDSKPNPAGLVFSTVKLQWEDVEQSSSRATCATMKGAHYNAKNNSLKEFFRTDNCKRLFVEYFITVYQALRKVPSFAELSTLSQFNCTAHCVLSHDTYRNAYMNDGSFAEYLYTDSEKFMNLMEPVVELYEIMKKKKITDEQVIELLNDL